MLIGREGLCLQLAAWKVTFGLGLVSSLAVFGIGAIFLILSASSLPIDSCLVLPTAEGDRRSMRWTEGVVISARLASSYL